MLADPVSDSSVGYARMLETYLRSPTEAALYQASTLSRDFILRGVDPEDIVAIHAETLEQIARNLSPREQIRATSDATLFLLEIMIAYGISYRQYLDERTTDAQRSEHALSEALAMIAHELRTPIASAQLSVDQGTRALAQGKLELVQARHSSTRTALERLSHLADDLVTASQGQSRPVQRIPIELSHVVRQACAWAVAMAQERHVALNCPAALDLATVLGDADSLLTVFGNVLSNAIRYTPEGGRVDVGGGADANDVWVSIADTGVGMASETRERVFERFYRGPDAHVVASQGLGLGLALVRQIVLAHGGRVEVRSEPGAGTTFLVVLPRLEV